MRTNRVKEKMRSGDKAYGFGIQFPSLQIVELMGDLEFDYVFIEGEHGAFSLTDIEQICIVADHIGLTPLARVPNIQPSTILSFLDRGVMGITGPHIKTKADAEMLAKSCRFAPEGIRSYYPNRVAKYAIPADIPAYMAHANEEVLVSALVEDEEGLVNLSEILSVDGLDMIIIGLMDLSQSLGEPGNPNHPRVKAAVDKAVEQIRASSKAYAAEVMSATQVSYLLKQGGREFLKKEKLERS